MRRAPRTDANQRSIVSALRAAGATVEPRLASLGGGVPDLLVGFRGACYVLEVKDPAKPPSKRKLTPDELAWRAGWAGQYAVVTTEDEALQAVGAVE